MIAKILTTILKIILSMILAAGCIALCALCAIFIFFHSNLAIAICIFLVITALIYAALFD